MECQNKKGFTLIEVIVSMALLVVVASILMSGIMGSFNINKRAKDILVAGYEQTQEFETIIIEGDSEEEVSNVTVSRNGENVTFLAMKHIYKYDPSKIMGFTVYTSFSREDVDTSTPLDPSGGNNIFAAGDTQYPIFHWGPIGDFNFSDNPYTSDGVGTLMIQNINSSNYGAVLEYNGDYYYIKDGPYVRNSPTPGNIIINGNDVTYAVFLTGANSVKMNLQKGITVPGPNTEKGDIRLNGSKLEIFAPSSYKAPPLPDWYYNDSSYWTPYALPPGTL